MKGAGEVKVKGAAKVVIAPDDYPSGQVPGASFGIEKGPCLPRARKPVGPVRLLAGVA